MYTDTNSRNTSGHSQRMRTPELLLVAVTAFDVVLCLVMGTYATSRIRRLVDTGRMWGWGTDGWPYTPHSVSVHTGEAPVSPRSVFQTDDVEFVRGNRAMYVRPHTGGSVEWGASAYMSENGVVVNADTHITTMLGSGRVTHNTPDLGWEEKGLWLRRCSTPCGIHMGSGTAIQQGPAGLLIGGAMLVAHGGMASIGTHGDECTEGIALCVSGEGGTLRLPAGGAFLLATSDRTMKSDVIRMEQAQESARVQKWRPVRYSWRERDERFAGFVAGDVTNTTVAPGYEVSSVIATIVASRLYR